MSIQHLATQLQGTPLALEIAAGEWWFPILETVHIFAIALVFGFIFMVDLRLVHTASRNQPISTLTGTLLPWTWGAFALAAASGGLMFIAKAVDYLANPAFQIKIAILALAGLNMVVFHLVTQRTSDQWDEGVPPMKVKVAGALSLVLWITIVATGRWIGFI